MVCNGPPEIRRNARARPGFCLEVLHASGEGWLWFVSSGWVDRTESLFSLTAEVAARIGDAPLAERFQGPQKRQQ